MIPEGYSKLPDGVICKCWKMWREPDGSTWCCLTTRPHDAIKNLRNHQVQCDMDGVMIQVSRQALDEVLAYLDATTPMSRPQHSAPGEGE